jgi:hypothetical protein
VLCALGCTRTQRDVDGGTAEVARAGLELTSTGLDLPRLQPSAAYQFYPGVGAGGGQLFAAWADGRFQRGAYYHVMGARLPMDGGAPDRPSVRVDDERSQFGEWPWVAYSQGRFLVTWLDDGPYRPWYRLYALDGSPVGPPELLLSSPGSSGGFPSASGADDHFLVVWGDYDGATALGLALVRLDGSRTTPDGGVGFGPPVASRAQLPRAAWSGANHVVTWLTEWRDGGVSIGVVPVAVDAGVPAPGAVQWLAGPSGIANTVPAVASSEGWVAVVWASAPSGVELALAMPDGGLGAPAPLLSTAGPVRELALAPVPGGFLLVRAEALDAGTVTVATPFSVDGGVLGPDQPVCTSCGDVAVTATGGGAWAVWTDGDFVVGAPLSVDGRRLAAPQRLAWGANAQVGSSVSACDGGFVVGWYDDREDSPGLRVSRVSALGIVERPEGVLLPPGPVASPSFPAVTGMVMTPTAGWLLAYGSPGATLYELTTDGDPVPGGARVVADTARFVQGPVPHRGGVAWAMAPSLGPGVLARVAADGTLLDGDVDAGDGRIHVDFPPVARGGRRRG